VTRAICFILVLLFISSGFATADSGGGFSLGALGGFFHRLIHGARPAPSPPAEVHYVIGPPYEAGGVWHYPHERFGYTATGIGSIYGAQHPALTTDGELFDARAMAAAHQTLQLPSVARVTNLENGRQALVRVNDRGPAAPGRLIELTPRAAHLLGVDADGAARVRVELDEARSQALALQLQGSIGGLRIAAAPVGAVQATDLPPPGGTTAPAQASRVQPAGAAGAPAEGLLPEVPLRLPEHVTQVAPEPGTLWVECDTFVNPAYAGRERAKLAGLGAEIVRRRAGAEAGATVRIGPIATVAQADAVLGQVLRAGVTGAHIVVEQE